MTEKWSYQVRVHLTLRFSDMARGDPADPRLDRLSDVLRRHDAMLACQFDAFAAYVADIERDGTTSDPLYKWTMAILDDPAKAARHKLVFAIRIAGQEVYPKHAADALEADLQALVDGTIIERLSKQDTNPANNIPVPTDYR